jgi:hypothetical protein
MSYYELEILYLLRSKPNCSERIYTDGEWYNFFAAQILGPWFFRQAYIPIGHVFRSTEFSGLRIAATSVGNRRANRNSGADFSRCPTCASSADG